MKRKKCAMCGKMKLLKRFSFTVGREYYCYCFPCSRANARAMYWKNPQHFRLLKKQWADDNKETVSAMKKLYHERKQRGVKAAILKVFLIIGDWFLKMAGRKKSSRILRIN